VTLKRQTATANGVAEVNGSSDSKYLEQNLEFTCTFALGNNVSGIDAGNNTRYDLKNVLQDNTNALILILSCRILCFLIKEKH
jgi:hypothetical protein